MKYLLIPFTMFLWYFTTCFGIGVVVAGMAFVFSLSWLWIMFGYLFLIGVVFAISNSIPSLMRLLILKIFGFNWVSCILHSLAGILGVVMMIQIYISSPPELVVEGKSVFLLSGMWDVAPFKTILIVPPFFGIVISLFWSTIIAPIYLKLTGEQI